MLRSAVSVSETMIPNKCPSEQFSRVQVVDPDSISQHTDTNNVRGSIKLSVGYAVNLRIAVYRNFFVNLVNLVKHN